MLYTTVEHVAEARTAIDIGPTSAGISTGLGSCTPQYQSVLPQRTGTPCTTSTYEPRKNLELAGDSHSQQIARGGRAVMFVPPLACQDEHLLDELHHSGQTGSRRSAIWYPHYHTTFGGCAPLVQILICIWLGIIGRLRSICWAHLCVMFIRRLCSIG